ncbi:EI24 domain-containing protein [Ruixingdingia sedimenti]|uniref:EI24 domain-containing protein n=1 Tax=Ruixingdingia sedimenti TaxID=3073604 RepID=A0ABU1F2R4_9RHOB|nr:EI24 domain-containing protein [Xinfangfangia sp. LG-4]MDR5651157.1 EI24 domain-containing protein [Xinfangfangia sp. LG-4]
MLADFLRAVGQIGDRRFRRVLFLGLILTFALLAGVYALFLGAIQILTPDSITIPWVGEVGGLDTLLSWGSLVFMIGLSVFLMVPVAAAFTGFFLDDVAQAVEDRHYPGLPPATPVPLMDQLIDSANFFGVLVALNVLALVLYAFAGPFIPVVFWGLNGFLLGREYFTLVAMRRLGRQGARELRRRHPAQVWLAGVLMAAPLSVPIVNLLIPVLGVATFTHLYHRLVGDASFRGSRNP